MIFNVIPKPNKIEYLGGEGWLDLSKAQYSLNENYGEEAYYIRFNEEGLTVTSRGEKGRYYAMLTLSQISAMGKVPYFVIYDEPAFPYRGFMIDSARHMQSLDEIKKYIEAAARYKFNIFHWHLCDDQGWRMEIEKYPRLTEIGAYRDCHGFGSENKEPYGGYYTKAQIREIIDFCRERYIEVVPEFDIPGHATAIIAAYPALSCRGREIPLKTEAGIFKDILCAGKEEVFDFCFGVLDEITELFPGRYIHIGGDEAPKARWCNCAYCQDRMKQEKLANAEELQGYFANRIIDYLHGKGREVLAWNESLNSGILNQNAIICDWMDRTHKCEAFANEGGRIIIEDFYHYYLDYPYGMTPLKKTYGLDPYLEKLSSTGRKGVMGVETPIWTEYVEDFGRMCYMCFPRMIAVAESGWTKRMNADYESFKMRLRNEREPLEKLGITMAAESEWDPWVAVRARDSWNHIKKSLTPSAIRATLMPNKDED